MEPMTIDEALTIWVKCDGNLGDFEKCQTCPLMTTTEWEELSVCSMFCHIRDALVENFDPGLGMVPA